MACESGYEIKLVEPNTSWKNKIGELAKRNKHEVPYEKLRQMKLDFESNIDLNRLISLHGTAKTTNSGETLPQSIAPVTIKAKLAYGNKFKSSGLLFGSNENFESFLQKNGSEWCMLEEGSKSSPVSTSSMSSSISMMCFSNQTVEYSNKEVQTNTDDCLMDRFLNTRPREIQGKIRSKSNESVQNSKVLKYDRSCDTLDLNDSLFDLKIEESVQTLNELFGKNYEKPYLVDLLMKYDNDLNTVANLLTENIELNEVLKQQQSACLVNPLKLSDICTKVLDSMNCLLIRHYSHVVEPEEEEIESIDFSESDESDSITEENSSNSGSSGVKFESEKTFQFKLDKKFAKALFNEFADPNDTFNENGKWISSEIF